MVECEAENTFMIRGATCPPGRSNHSYPSTPQGHKHQERVGFRWTKLLIKGDVSSSFYDFSRLVCVNIPVFNFCLNRAISVLVSLSPPLPPKPDQSLHKCSVISAQVEKTVNFTMICRNPQHFPISCQDIFIYEMNPSGPCVFSACDAM